LATPLITSGQTPSREKNLKGWSRNWKIHQIEKTNPLPLVIAGLDPANNAESL